MSPSSQHVAAAVAALSLLGAYSVQAGQATPATSRPKLVAPVKGEARVEITKPNTKVAGKDVVTTMMLKNIEPKPIAGLKVEEHWYDRSGTPVSGTTYRHRMPLQPGEVITIVLRTPHTPQLSRNQYTFGHSNGKITQKIVPKLVAPKPEVMPTSK
jgi:uncharacterized protein YcfL